MSPAVYRFRGLLFDPADGQLRSESGTASTQLRPQVARLLLAFVEQPQTLIEREQLCAAVWDAGTVIDFESGLAAVLRELRAELKKLDAPADLIETIPRRGYRLNCPLDGQSASPGFSRAGRKRLLGLAAALVLLALATVYALWPQPAPMPAESQARTLAVLPFQLFGETDPEQRRLDLLLADQMLVHLWERQIEGVDLIGRSSTAPYQDPDERARMMAENLGVDLLIEGSVAFESGRVSVSARLLEMPAGRILWSQQLDFAAAESPPAAALAEMLVESLDESWPN